MDETYIKARGRWCYLYRAIDRDGALVDVMLSERRDLAAAKRFFRSAKAVTGASLIGSPVMDTMPIRGRSTPSSARTSSTGPTCISIIDWNRIIEARWCTEPGDRGMPYPLGSAGCLVRWGGFPRRMAGR